MRSKPSYSRGIRLYEAGAALLFFGVFSQNLDLQQAGTAALAELSALGYQVPSANDPVRIFPALTQARFSRRHAGGWRPGSVYLREQPEGDFNASVYLRHELFHEASFRSCGGRLPEWAEELAAMRFSGELTGTQSGVWPGDAELENFKAHVRQGHALNHTDRQLLKRLASNSDWPANICTVPAHLVKLLTIDNASTGFSYLLMSLPSARILSSDGDTDSRLPPGSLLKIPYAAALRQANPGLLAKELAVSDTDKLLSRRKQLQMPRYRLLLSPIHDNRLPEPIKLSQDWRSLLGERGANGGFPVQASLPELALTMRAALLSQAGYFKELSRNGSLPGSTLAGQRADDKQVLQRLHVMAKTGSASTANGQPLYGHLLLAWPAEHPVYLAVFRQHGLRGAALLPKAADLLKNWQRDYPVNAAVVRVRLLALTPRDSWEADADCPELQAPNDRFSLCGHYRIVSTAYGSRSQRWVRGVLHKSAAGPEVLETDSISYTDAVVAAEAKFLSGGAREALRAVITWNGSHGQHRHPETDSLCDNTHCMVFLGQLSPDKINRGGAIDTRLLSLLDRLAAAKQLDWLPFATGGEQRWQQQIPAQAIKQRFAEDWILDIRRQRRKNGDIVVHLIYPQQEETLRCEVFRNALKLPSCPDSIQFLAHQDAWLFKGIGAGHGLGLSLHQAQALADRGRSAVAILKNAYGVQ